jgi:hypothetical protein
MPTKPTLHPARLYGTQGAGALCPSAVSRLKFGSGGLGAKSTTRPVQYANMVDDELVPSALKYRIPLLTLAP